LYYVADVENSEQLNIKGVLFRKESNSKDNEGFLGFFDWLRLDENTIVGIRLCYFEHQAYNVLLTSYPYIRLTFDGKCMELLFEGDVYNPDISGDQDFANNYVFKSESEDYLFTFGLDHLTRDELNGLKKQCEVLDAIDVIRS